MVEEEFKLGDYVKTGLRCGINSALTGNFLTTTGTTIEKDKKDDRGVRL